MSAAADDHIVRCGLGVIVNIPVATMDYFLRRCPARLSKRIWGK
jgi:hypothetical protein